MSSWSPLVLADSFDQRSISKTYPKLLPRVDPEPEDHADEADDPTEGDGGAPAAICRPGVAIGDGTSIPAPKTSSTPTPLARGSFYGVARPLTSPAFTACLGCSQIGPEFFVTDALALPDLFA
jgi:hypothetical protein